MRRCHSVLVEDQVWEDGKNAGINMSVFLEDSLSKVLYSEGAVSIGKDLTPVKNIIKNNFMHIYEAYKRTKDRGKIVVLKRLLQRQYEIHVTVADLIGILESDLSE